MESVEGVILGAGLSQRAGTLKMLLDLEGMTLIERCIMGMYDLCSRIIVVVGHEYERIEEVIKGYEKVTMIYNPSYLEGMYSSVKVGFKEVKVDRFFFIPGDYPLVKKETYKNMLGVNGDIVIPFFCGKKGHPLLIKSTLLPKFFGGDDYQNLRDFVRDVDYKGIEVEDEGILMDIDTMDDYWRILELYSGYFGSLVYGLKGL